METELKSNVDLNEHSVDKSKVLELLSNISSKIIAPMITYFIAVIHIGFFITTDRGVGNAIFILSPLFLYILIIQYYIESESRIMIAKLLLEEGVLIHYKKHSFIKLLRVPAFILLIIHFLYEILYIYNYEYNSLILTTYLISSIQLITWLLFIIDYFDANTKTSPISTIEIKNVKEIIPEGKIEILCQLIRNVKNKNKGNNKVINKEINDLLNKSLSSLNEIEISWRIFISYGYDLMNDKAFQTKHSGLNRQSKYMKYILICSFIFAIIIEIYGFNKLN